MGTIVIKDVFYDFKRHEAISSWMRHPRFVYRLDETTYPCPGTKLFAWDSHRWMLEQNEVVCIPETEVEYNNRSRSRYLMLCEAEVDAVGVDFDMVGNPYYDDMIGLFKAYKKMTFTYNPMSKVVLCNWIHPLRWLTEDDAEVIRAKERTLFDTWKESGAWNKT